MTRRVVVTGTGIVSGIGTSTDEFWRNCLDGHTVVERIPSHWTKYERFKSTLWAPLPPIDYGERGISRPQRMQHDPVSLNAILAAREAVSAAGWRSPAGGEGAGAANQPAGVYVGTGIGGSHTFLDNHLHPVCCAPKKRLSALLEDDTLPAGHREELDAVVELMQHPRRINPFMASMYMPNTVAASLGIEFSMRGPNRTYCQACASGTVAVGEAFRAIKRGEVDMALAGGSEYFYDQHGYLFQAFDVAGTLAQDCDEPESANCPFDERRSGFLFSQGASVILALESLESAVQRGAPVLAEITGYAESFDAHNMMAMAPGGEQIEQMIRSAVSDAGLTLERIDYINTHGTGTPSNDRIEADVLDRLFGKRPLVNATKSLVGHTIGASGAMEAAVLALSLYHQTTHPCRSLRNPVADLNFVSSAGEFDLGSGISQSFAFGGHNAAVVMSRFARS
ncbi:MAG TPA: beta-ketoacyl-[acyl-carrier-protein] synthase family protein [Arenicellales bacterium]|nr:beta-ketoacyl-[acyl-carrier-protein] synthase family protein [Arenicellales bacterium]